MDSVAVYALCELLGQGKVEELRVARAVEHDRLRREVAVDDVVRVAREVLERKAAEHKVSFLAAQ